MDSADFSEFSIPSHDSRILSESLVFPSSSSRSTSQADPDNSDLSLSELSLGTGHLQSGAREKRPFSLLARPIQDESAVVDDDDAQVEGQGEGHGAEGGEMDATMTQEDIENAKRLAARTREEKLQHDLFILKKLNAAFEVYKDALRETKSATDRVSEQLTHTNALLDKYTTILHRSEKITKLILDERWEGAEGDEAQLELERQAEFERRRREEEERVLAVQKERERIEREERERKEKAEKERLAKEKAELVKANALRGIGSSGVRGVRGTRASMRAASAVRGGGRGLGTPPSGLPTSSSMSMRGRPGSSASVRSGSSASRGIPRKVT